ncbi:amino acid adenylation domain-containing protein [Metabacillus iocasae]|uniref:Amino acid adenylation domain-containing protein n=1 Tax=Priestia iocasae TaxID=2291674 RepID=A0ABS2QU49_9BACI|nr:amino acid adenylation domain-containing protein [Metabacillus iocasae]MBM7702286.1 amino acid adenylation domain-containing protein [Metabacillus iocasae]
MSDSLLTIERLDLSELKKLYVHSEGLLHANFLGSVLNDPNALALSIENQEWTYQEVLECALTWATTIKKHCRKPKRIGIFAYRSQASYIGVLASLLAGATFVPLNPQFPAERTKQMIESADMDVIIVGQEAVASFQELSMGLEVSIPVAFLPDATLNTKLPTIRTVIDQHHVQHGYDFSEMERTSDSIAYLLFTSGSTGNPKGVPVTHANVVHFLNVNQAKYQIHSEDRLSQTFDQTFDLSIFDLFMAWSNGAAVCSIKPIQLLSPLQFIEEKNITVWFSVPSLITLMRKQRLLTKGVFPRLRLSLFCGEPLHKSSVQAWREAAPNSIIENLYGPTELTIACSSYRWMDEESEAECINEIVPIGKMNDGLQHVILDEQSNPVKEGEVGELCVAGPQTFPGYWRNEELTNSRLVKVVADTGEERVYYRTGDQVMVLPSGNMGYIGRTDFQVKVNGYRIECGEIEGSIAKDPNVLSAVVLPWPIENGTAKGLRAFVVGNDLEPKAIIHSISAELPAYMIPNKIDVLDKMPLNSNGKVDRKQLYQRLEGRR